MRFWIKKLCLLILLITVFFIVLPVEAKKTLNDAGGALTTVVGPSGITESEVSVSAANVVKGIMAAIGLLFFCLMVYAGLVWMTARGEEERVTKARETIIAATIGLVIMVSSYAVTNLVTDRIIGGAGAGSADFNANGGAGGSNIGCCITPVDIYSIASAIPNEVTFAGCQELAYNVWGKPDAWDSTDINTEKGDLWNFYAGEAQARACVDIAQCWIAETGDGQEKCINDAIDSEEDPGLKYCLTCSLTCTSMANLNNFCKSERVFASQTECEDKLPGTLFAPPACDR